MPLRSLLFVPGDRPERFGKATGSGADAVILDLEDSVAPERKAYARDAVAAALAAAEPPGARTVRLLVRINPVDASGHGEAVMADLAALAGVPAVDGPAMDGIVLPKAEGKRSLDDLGALLAAHGMVPPPLLPIATETPAAMFRLGEYAERAEELMALSWGAEDLPAAVGAATAREADGSWAAPYELARSLALFGAGAAGVPAIETVFPAFRDGEGLRRMAARAARDGFDGMLAIHPEQIEAIHAAFTPDAAAVAAAERVVAAFAAAEGRGAVALDGRMLDAPHLLQARRVIARARRDAGG